MPGRPPDPNAIRRNARVGVVRLPGAGRTGRIPKWPLPDDPRLAARIEILTEDIETLEELEADGHTLTRNQSTKLTRARERLRSAELERDAIDDTEKKLWRLLWRTPQATQWERLRWDREVAQYVRHKAAAEVSGSLEHSREARFRAESLGLTPRSMRSLMWFIDHDELAERRDPEPAPRSGARRLRAVDSNTS